MAKIDIQISDLVITYNQGKANEFNALSHISAEIYPREYIILFGPSGCGKSTLLYTILGGVPPAGGHLFVKGEDIYAYTPAEMNLYQQATIGIVYQAFNLINSISVLDNVALPRVFLDKSPAERNERARHLLRRFGIPDRLESKQPVMMSGGQQQRVAVARSLINDPEILLADEPVGNLDSISAEHVMDSFKEINEKDRKTVILVTHDAKYLPYAHRVFYMRDGILRRIVVNPEKTQIKHVKPGETIVTEIEQLARLYPYAEPLELKVKSIINFAMQNISFSQIERIEKNILNVLKGIVDPDMFQTSLTKRFADGGVGMSPEEGLATTQKIFGLIEHSRSIERFRASIHDDHLFMQQQKFIDDVITYLGQEVGYHASPQQEALLRTAVSERVSGIIGATEFGDRLALPVDEGGAAFSEHDAALLARYLEKLVAQGAYVIQSNELLGAHS